MIEGARRIKPPRHPRRARTGWGLLGVLSGALGLGSACLNPEISDEPPISASAIAVGDAILDDTTLDDVDDTPLDDTETAPDAGIPGFGRSTDDVSPPSIRTAPPSNGGRGARTPRPPRR